MPFKIARMQGKSKIYKGIILVENWSFYSGINNHYAVLNRGWRKWKKTKKINAKSFGSHQRASEVEDIALRT